MKNWMDEMDDLHCTHSEDSDDGSASDHYAAPFMNCDGSQLEETFKLKLENLKTEINKLNLDFDQKHQRLTDETKKLEIIINKLESMHKKTKVGSLTGSMLGAAGGTLSIVGLSLAPVTAGASLAFTAAGTFFGVAGGVTGTASDIINNNQQKKLREDIEMITSDFQNTINLMNDNLNIIIYSTDHIQRLVHDISARMIRPVSFFSGLPKNEKTQKSQVEQTFDTVVGWSKEAFKIVKLCSGAIQNFWSISEVIKNANLSLQAVKTARLASKAAKSARLSLQAAKTARLALKAAKSAHLSLEAVKSTHLSLEAAKTARLASKAAKSARLTSKAAKSARLASQAARVSVKAAKAAKAAKSALAFSFLFSSCFVVIDLFSIFQDSEELDEMNQSADKTKSKNIKSDTLKFIHQMRETVSEFQKYLDEIKDTRDNANKEFEKELENGTSFLLRLNCRSKTNVLFLKSIVLISIIVIFSYSVFSDFFRVTLYK